MPRCVGEVRGALGELERCGTSLEALRPEDCIVRLVWLESGRLYDEVQEQNCHVTWQWQRLETGLGNWDLRYLSETQVTLNSVQGWISVKKEVRKKSLDFLLTFHWLKSVYFDCKSHAKVKGKSQEKLIRRFVDFSLTEIRFLWLQSWLKSHAKVKRKKSGKKSMISQMTFHWLNSIFVWLFID